VIEQNKPAVREQGEDYSDDSQSPLLLKQS